MLNFVYQVVFRTAFAIFILIQVILVALCAAFITPRWLSPSAEEAVLVLWFAGVFLIGAESYFVFQRIARKEWIYNESQRWLAERRQPNPRRAKRWTTMKNLALWIPTAAVVLICVFFDGIWAIASHILHSHAGKLIGYEVPIPLNWTIAFSETHDTEFGARSMVAAARFRGLLLAGSGLYIGRKPPFSISTMSFFNIPSGDPFASRSDAKIISVLKVPFGESAITCWEEPPSLWVGATNSTRCSTSLGDFSAYFNGGAEDAKEFYHILQSVKKR